MLLNEIVSIIQALPSLHTLFLKQEHKRRSYKFIADC